jgi:hypothetical protein
MIQLIDFHKLTYNIEVHKDRGAGREAHRRSIGDVPLARPTGGIEKLERYSRVSCLSLTLEKPNLLPLLQIEAHTISELQPIPHRS